MMHQVLNELVKVDKIKTDYKTMKDTTTFKKLTSPFKRPGMVIVCALYLAGQFAFIITAATTYNEMNQLGIQVLNGGGWVVIYIIAIIVGIIANMYAFVVAGFWIMVVATMLAIIVFIVIMIVLVCSLCPRVLTYAVTTVYFFICLPAIHSSCISTWSGTL